MLFAGTVAAQPLQWPVQAFTAEQGLGGATITSLAQDARGFLWVGTPDELLLYDGHQFTPFRYPSRTGNRVSFRRAVVLSTGTTGFLLLHEEGAHQYSFRSGQFRPVAVPFSHPAALAIQSFAPDTAHKGWYRFVSTYGCGLYQPATLRWKLLQTWALPRVLAVPANGAGTALEIKQDTVAGQIQVADVFSGRTADSFPFPLAVLSGARLSGGLLFVSKEAQPRLWWKAVGQAPRFLSTLPAPVPFLQVLETGRQAYVAAGASLFLFQPVSGFFQPIQNEAGEPVVSKGVVSHLKRFGNTLWLGTNAAGLVRISLAGPRFQSLHSAVPAHNFVHAILPDAAGIFTGSFYGAFVRYSKSGVFAEDLSAFLKPPYTQEGTYYFNHLERLSDGWLFVAGGRSFYLFHPEKHLTADLTPSYRSALLAAGIAPEKGPGRKTVRRAGDRQWWITEAGGLTRWELQGAGKSARLRLLQYLPFPLPPPEGLCFWKESWWAAHAGTLYRLGAAGIADSFSLPQKSLVTCLQPDLQGRLWIATESGILVWQEGRTRNYLSTETGLPNNHVYALLPDAAGWMWGSTNGGLFAINTATFEVRVFAGGEGLQGLEFNMGAFAADAAGNFYFGGMNGTSIFRPDRVLQLPPPGRVTLTRIAGPDTVYYRYPGAAKLPGLQISYRQAHLQIAYTAAQAAATALPRYEYRLNPGERWTEALEGELQLTLAPGTYQIQVQVKGHPQTAALLAVHIIPPFYQTPLFLALLIAGITVITGSLLWASARGKYRRRLVQLEAAKRMQEEKERISRELHDELGARAALIAHNTGQLENALEKDLDIHFLTARITDTTTDMLTALRETVWTLKQETVTAGSLWLRYKNFIAQLSATYVPLHFVVLEEIFITGRPLYYAHALNVLRILQEAVMNAVRHSGATEIRIAVGEEKGHLWFSVRDNGTGFDMKKEQAAQRGNGLHNMEQRSAESCFSLSIGPAAGGGTQVRLDL